MVLIGVVFKAYYEHSLAQDEKKTQQDLIMR